MFKKRKKNIMLTILRVVFVMTLFFFIGALLLYFNLDVGEQSQEADVIVVPEGSRDRAYKASDLLNEGYSRSEQIIVSPAIDPLGFDARPAYYSRGVADENLIYENEATSTWTNATNTIDIMQENNWDSALIVSSDYHTRRTRLAFERASDDLDIDFTYISSYRNNNGEKVTYQDNRNGRHQGRNEVWKYIGYFLGLYNLIDT